MVIMTEAPQQPVDVEKEVAITDNASHSPDMMKKLDDKILKHSHDADAAMKAFEGMDGQVLELTPEKNKALLRKIDWHLMPVSIDHTLQNWS
jgi:ACS family allantoate permease-like MFS transporter